MILTDSIVYQRPCVLLRDFRDNETDLKSSELEHPSISIKETDVKSSRNRNSSMSAECWEMLETLARVDVLHTTVVTCKFYCCAVVLHYCCTAAAAVVSVIQCPDAVL